MENIAERISVFHNLYLACLIGTLLFLAISVFLFIRLDISGVIGFFTGQQAKREIKKIQEKPFEGKAGKKMIKPETKSESGQHKTGDVWIRKVENLPQIMVTRKLENGFEESTDILKTCEATGKETEVLQQEESSFYIEREILLIHTDEIIE